MNRFFFSAALAAVTLAAGAAAAQSDQMVVNVADLNLSTHQGAAVALKRIDNAAAKFCGGSDSERDIGRLLEQQKCVAQMTDKAVGKLDTVLASRTPQPTILVASRSGH